MSTLAYKRIYCKKIGEMIALKESANWSPHKDDHHQTFQTMSDLRY